MKTIFDKETRGELINRINSLNENSKAQWGKMNVYQMLKHCTLWAEWIEGSPNNKQVFIGRLFGKIALKNVLKDEEPMRKNSPTTSEFKIQENTGDVEVQKQKWTAAIEAHAHFSHPTFVHPFFGKMTKKEIGYLAYKHSDHHLRQFNS